MTVARSYEPKGGTLASKTPARTLTFPYAHVMLVEGPDDLEFACAQIEQCGQPSKWLVHSMGGKDTDWESTIGLVRRDAWFKTNGQSISVAGDADSSVAAATKRLKASFGKGLPLPATHGDVTSGGKCRTGLFVFPDGAKNGELEDLLIAAIAKPDRLKLARQYIKDSSTQFGAPKKLAKAELQAYLAGEQEFVKWVQDAIKEKLIPMVSSDLEPFRDFIRRLQA